MPLVLGGQSATAAAFSVDNSCRFNRADSALLSITPAGDGNKRTFTLSIWVKRSDIGSIGTASVNMMMDAVGSGGLSFYETDAIKFYIDNVYGQATTVLYKDPSAWMHIVQAVDTTDAVAGDRIKTYVNGVRVTDFSSENNPPINTDSKFNNSSVVMTISQASASFGGYIAEAIMIDGLQLEPTSFGQFNDDSPTIWEPIDPSGLTFGTNGFYLDFKDSADLGNDVSGNDNDMTSTNLAAGDQAVDSPTNNFNTWNRLWGYRNPYSTYAVTLDEGNCNWARNDDTACCGTMAVSKGKWYVEYKVTVYNNYTSYYFGVFNVVKESGGAAPWSQWTNTDSGAGISNSNNYLHSPPLKNVAKRVDGTNTVDYSTNKCDVGDILGFCLNLDDNEIEVFNTNVSIAAAFSITGGRLYVISHVLGGSAGDIECNFGGCPGFTDSATATDENGYGKFVYAPPSGFLAMCTKNLGTSGG